MNKILVTDMDDVLNHLLVAWLKHLNTAYNLDVKYEDVTDWNMQKAYPTLTPNEIYGVLHDKEFWEMVEPDYEAVYYLRKLYNEGFKILVATASSHNTIQAKVNNNLLPYFDFLSYKDVISIHDKHLLKCDYIIDDYPPNIENSTAIRFLKDAPYNKNTDKSNYEFRVTRWKEIYNKIHKLLEAENMCNE